MEKCPFCGQESEEIVFDRYSDPGYGRKSDPITAMQIDFLTQQYVGSSASDFEHLTFGQAIEKMGQGPVTEAFLKSLAKVKAKYGLEMELNGLTLKEAHSLVENSLKRTLTRA